MMIKDQVSRRHVLGGAIGLAAAPVIIPFAMSSRARAQDAAPVPPPLEAYSKLPTISRVALSPDGTRMAMLMNKNGELMVVDFEFATGKAAAAAIDSDKIRTLMWADNDHVLVVTSTTEMFAGKNYEQPHGLIFDLRGGKRYQMYRDVPGVGRPIVTGDFNRITLDGKPYVTGGGYRMPDGISTSYESSGSTETMNRCLYAFNANSSRPIKLDEDARDVEDWVITGDGKVVARSDFDDDTKMWTLRYRTEKGWRDIYKIKAEYDMPALCGLGRDGKSVLLYFRQGEYQNRYVEVSGDGVFSAPVDINGASDSPIFHPTDFRLVGFSNTGGLAHYTFFDPVFAKLPALIKKAVGDIYTELVGCADDPLHVLIFVEGEGNAGTYYSIDFTKGGYKEVGSSYPNVPAEWVSEKKPYSYTAADGLEIPAWLSLPVDRDPTGLALVVLPHGGPAVYEDGHFDFLSQVLTTRGYAVLQPNFRGSAGFGQDYTARGYGEWGRKMQTDLSDGVRALVKEGTVDAKRVAIYGGSYGGYAALAGVTLDASVYNCAVSQSGISDIEAFTAYELENSGFDGNSYTMDYWNRFLGDKSRWDEISPIKHIDAVKVPIMLIHGKDDVVVPFDQSTRFYDAMQKAGKPVEMVVLSEEDHWMSREPTRMQIVESMVNFMLKHNPPV